MKRYLVCYLWEGEFHLQTVMADNIQKALERFDASGGEWDEVYSVTRAA